MPHLFLFSIHAGSGRLKIIDKNQEKIMQKVIQAGLPKLELEFAREVGGKLALAVRASRINSHWFVLCVVVIGAVALSEGAVSCSLIVCRWLRSDRAELPGLGCSATEARRDLLP